MPRKRPMSPAATLPDEGLQPIIRLWLLRILISLGGHKEWLQPHGFRCAQLAQVLGLLAAWLLSPAWPGRPWAGTSCSSRRAACPAAGG